MNRSLDQQTETAIPIRGIARTAAWSGAYLLHIELTRPACLQIGAYNGGQIVQLTRGHYAYVGSAMGRRAGLYVPKRLLRHATRTGEKPPHPCHAEMLAHFQELDLPGNRLRMSAEKRIFWNIDYVLDDVDTALVEAFYVRSEYRLENQFVHVLENRPDTSVPLPGLGAHDHPGHSHFFCLDDGHVTWRDCCRQIESTLAGPK
jgi:Uri superfamily endonuclease